MTVSAPAALQKKPRGCNPPASVARPSGIAKVVSGGQTGIDRAALDAALACGIPVGGWCPRGRRAEDGLIPARYPLVETPSRDYRERTRWNVRDADGTLILMLGELTGGTALTWRQARRLRRPVFIADLRQASPHVREDLSRWTARHRVRVLNIAGPRGSLYSEGYALALEFLKGWWRRETCEKT